MNRDEQFLAGTIVDFSPHCVTIQKIDGTTIVLTCEEPDSFEYDIIKKIWEVDNVTEK